MRASFRHCYQHALDANPNLKGRVHLELHIDCRGQVFRLTARTEGLNDEVVNCVLSEAGNATFDASDESVRVIEVRITFINEST